MDTRRSVGRTSTQGRVDYGGRVVRHVEPGGGHAGVRDRERDRQVGQRQAGFVRDADELLHGVDAALVAEVRVVRVFHREVDACGVAKLCIPPIGTDDNSRADRMIALLVDGLRYGAKHPAR